MSDVTGQWIDYFGYRKSQRLVGHEEPEETTFEEVPEVSNSQVCSSRSSALYFCSVDKSEVCD